MWIIRHYLIRLVCLFKGCEEHHESHWNMPDDWRSPTFCDRCGAVDDVYNIESTPYELIYSGDKFIWRLRAYFSH